MKKVLRDNYFDKGMGQLDPGILWPSYILSGGVSVTGILNIENSSHYPLMMIWGTGTGINTLPSSYKRHTIKVFYLQAVGLNWAGLELF